MRIAMLNIHSDPAWTLGTTDAGGQIVYVVEVSRRLAEEYGDSVDIYTRLSGPYPEVETLRDRLRVVRLVVGPRVRLPKEAVRGMLSELGDAFMSKARDGGYDLVHSHYWDGGAVGAKIAEELGLPLVHTFHSLGLEKLRYLGGDGKWRVELEMRIASVANVLVAESEYELSVLIKDYGVPESKVEVVPPGVDTEFFKPVCRKDEAKTRLGLEGEPLVLALGRPDRRKGFEHLIAALGVLSRRGVRFRAIVSVGEGITEEERRYVSTLRSTIKEEGLEGRVELWDPIPRSDLPLYYTAADVFVLPSLHEHFGMAILEAMACGTPVVATRFGGPSTFLNKGGGVLVDPRDHEELADALELLVLNRSLREEMGGVARRRAVREFDWGVIVPKLRVIYSGLVG